MTEVKLTLPELEDREVKALEKLVATAKRAGSTLSDVRNSAAQWRVCKDAVDKAQKKPVKKKKKKKTASRSKVSKR